MAEQQGVVEMCPRCRGTTETTRHGLLVCATCLQSAYVILFQKFAPLECVECHSETGPLWPLDGDCAGWLCPTCYDVVSKACQVTDS